MAEVKLTITATEHQLLLALLNYWAGKLSGDQLAAILVSCGYKPVDFAQQITYVSEQLAAAIQ